MIYQSIIFLKNLGLSTHFARRLPRRVALPKAFQTISGANRLKGFVASIELHSNQMWQDLREFYSLLGVVEWILKVNKY